jgi:hypothetical protein
MRRGAVPYKDEPEECDILVNDRAAEAIKAAGADRFVNLIDPTNPKLVKLLTIMVGRTCKPYCRIPKPYSLYPTPYTLHPKP